MNSERHQPPERRGNSNSTLLQSISKAFRGIMVAIRSERNVKIHLVATVLVVIAGVRHRVSAVEWTVLCLCVAMVMVAELLNTAIEKTLDRIGDELHPLARDAKDIAAGAVLTASIFAVVIAVVIFWERFF